MSSYDLAFCDLQPAREIVPDSIEKKIADRMADCLDVFARAAIWVGGEVSVDVDVTNGGSVKHNGPPVA